MQNNAFKAKLLGFVSIAAMAANLLLISAPALARYGKEIEIDNNSSDKAQNIDGLFSLDFDPNIEDSVSIPHASIWGRGFADYCDFYSSESCPDEELDFYSFTVKTSESRGIFDIDFTTGGIDPFFYLFDNSYQMLVPPVDDADNGNINLGAAGSVSPLDPYFQYLFKPGTYFLGVGFVVPTNSYPKRVSGNYTLHISIENHATVPEPSTVFGLLGLGLLVAKTLRKSQRVKST